MITLLERIAAHRGTDSIYFLTELINKLRPPKPHQIDQATANVRTLTQLLQGKHDHASALRQYLLRVFSARHQTNLYTDTGILSSNGFFTELFQRFSNRLLPPAVNDGYLLDCLDQILPVNSDYLWMKGVPAADWLALLDILASAGAGDEDAACQQKTLKQLRDAIQTLSYRISAMGLEPELIRNKPELEAFESPFLMQHIEVQGYLDGYTRLLNGTPMSAENDKHLLVMLEQCDTVVAKIRKNALHHGTSIALTYLLVRLTQSIDRLRKLLALLDVSRALIHPVPASDAALSAALTTRCGVALELGLELVEAHNRKYAVHELFTSNINLLARNVTENASRTGERYLTKNRRDYNSMFRSAAGAGAVVGVMAMITIFVTRLHVAPLVEAFLLSLNYSLGLILIHVLHLTVATKQPAMTAARIAAELHSRDGRNIDLDSLAELISNVMRTQFVAVLGNILMVIPIAYLLARGYFYLEGQHLVSAQKAVHMLHNINPLNSLALFYAVITGVCLFVVGLISGYYDNKSLYTHIRVRIAQLRWLKRLLGEYRLKKFAAYIESNLGGLMGSLNFGIMLGSIGILGLMLGLPIDIRQITFSAANFAIAIFSLDNHATWQTVVIATLGIFSIGAVNLLVSFSLALFVALRSRQVRFTQWTALLKALLMRFLIAPAEFFMPPRSAVEMLAME